MAFFIMVWLFSAQNILINKSPCRGYTSFAVLLQLNWKKKKITFVSKRFRGKSDIFFDLNKENCIFLCEKTGNKNVCQRAICRTSFYWQQCSIWGRGMIFFSLQLLGFLHMWLAEKENHHLDLLLDVYLKVSVWFPSPPIHSIHIINMTSW